MNHLLKAFTLLSLLIASIVQAQDDGLSPKDLARVGEYGRVLSGYGPQVWPQWKQTPPLLVRKGEADYLVGYPLEGAPPTFGRLNQQALGGWVYRRSGHLLEIPTVMVWPMGTIWTVAIPTLPELQIAVDREIGAGVLKLSEQFYLRSMFHEGVHAFLRTQMEGKLPGFGFSADEALALQELEARPAFNQQITEEGRLLTRGLLAAGQAEVRQLAREFIELRFKRRAQLSAQAVALEKALEWKEGLTRYTEVSLMRLLGGQKNPELSLSYPSSQSTWNEFLAQCSMPTLVAGALRERYMAMGAAQAFLLDRLMPNWKARALPGGESLEQLLAEASK